jgi:hypothetical protein
LREKREKDPERADASGNLPLSAYYMGGPYAVLYRQVVFFAGIYMGIFTINFFFQLHGAI